MGGFGSGRNYHWDKKSTVDEYLRLEAHRIATEVGVDQQRFGSWRWSWKTGWGEEKEANIAFQVLPEIGHAGGLRLHYQVSGEPVEPYAVHFDTTSPHFGGLRYWWLCPQCMQRCAHIYGGRLFLCRRCHDLTYASTQTAGDTLARARRKLRKICRRLSATGGDPWDPMPDKPPYMHWDTYSQLEMEYYHWRDVGMWDFKLGVHRLMGHSVPAAAKESLADGDIDRLVGIMRATGGDLFQNVRTFEEVQRDWLEELTRELERELERKDPKRTLGEISRAGGVSYEFAKEARREGLIQADRGRGKRVRRYRPKLASWLRKLHIMRQGGLSWEEILAWTRRRFTPGHEKEQRWPAGFDAEIAG